jgi:hypothetical protein
MLAQKLLGWLRGAQPEPETVQEPETCEIVDLRTKTRARVFKHAVLALEDHYKIPAVITDLSANGALVRYTVRMDLPSRLFLIEQSVPLKKWARVVWQETGEAGLEFIPDER